MRSPGALEIPVALGGQGEALGGWEGHLEGGGVFIRPLGVPSDPWGSLQIPVALRGQGEALGGWGVFMRSPGALEIPVVLRGQGEALGGGGLHQTPGGPFRSLGVP